MEDKSFSNDQYLTYIDFADDLNKRIEGVKDALTLGTTNSFTSTSSDTFTSSNPSSFIEPINPGSINFSYIRNGRSNKWTAKDHQALTQYWPLIIKYASNNGLDPLLVAAVITIESNWNTSPTSNKGAQGLMQLTSDNSKAYGVTNPFDPEQNIRAGCKLLSENIHAANGDIINALAIYNAGIGNFKSGKWKRFSETQNYIKDVPLLQGLLHTYYVIKNTQSNSITNPLQSQNYSGYVTMHDMLHK